MRVKAALAVLTSWLFQLAAKGQTVIPPTTYPAGPTTVADGTITTGGNTVVVPNGANVTYQAGQWIRLEPGFQATGGGLFHGQIISGDTQAPSPPGNLWANNITTSSFTTTWSAATDNVGVAGYQVQLNGAPIGTTASLSFPIGGLYPNTTYAVSVRAYDASGNYSSSVTVFVTTQSGPQGDSDGDGIPDSVEQQLGTDPNTPTAIDNTTNAAQLNIHKPQ